MHFLLKMYNDTKIVKHLYYRAVLSHHVGDDCSIVVLCRIVTCYNNNKTRRILHVTLY
jgi:hypothetical protein